MKKTSIIFSLIVILAAALLFTGCKKSEIRPLPSEQKQAGTDVSDITADISEVDSLNKELNDSELNNLDSDLQAINW